MKYALFLGCQIPHYVPQYEVAVRKVLGKFGVQLVDVEFNCCGYPMRDLHLDSSLLAAARNMALAQARGLDLVTPCMCCFGHLKWAASRLAGDSGQLARVQEALAEENLSYSPETEVKHVLSVLNQDVGLEELKKSVTTPLKNLRVAALHGCHAVRPSKITQFDDPDHPGLIDRLVEVTGAKALDWNGKLSCCGAPIHESNPEVSLTLIRGRLEESRQAEADVFCVSCTHTQMQTERLAEADLEPGVPLNPPPVLFVQLLGLAMGLSPRELGQTNGRFNLDQIRNLIDKS